MPVKKIYLCSVTNARAGSSKAQENKKLGKKTYFSYLQEKLVSVCPEGRPITGFEILDAPLGKKDEWKKIHVVPMSDAINCGSEAVKATRKALGKAVVGHRLVGEPVHLLNPETL
jgi:hypothetical protein